MSNFYSNTNKHSLYLCVLLILFHSCIPLIKDEPAPVDTPDTTPPSVWQPLQMNSSTELIKSIHGTTDELQFIHRQEFMRYNDKFALIEKRSLFIDSLLNTPPIVSDNFFALFTVNPDNRQVMELHFAKSKKNVRRISTALMADTAKRQAFDFDLTGRNIGCFNDDGSKLILVGTMYPALKPYALLFEIKPNFSGDDFDKVAIIKSVEMYNSNIRKTESCRFLNNNFYIATKEGGYRMTQDGFIKKLFNHHTLDFFESNGKLYSTGNSPSDFQVSSNNGLTWQKAGTSDLKYIEKEGNKIFSQKSINLSFGLADSVLVKVKDIQYPTNLLSLPNNYYNIGYFKNRYIVNIGKNIYSVQSLTTK